MDVACESCGCQQKISRRRGSFTRTLSVSVKMELLVLVLIAVLGLCSGQNTKVDVDGLLNSLDEGSRKIPVALNWGIADSSAVIGKLFNYAIPSDAFKGDIVSYKVTEAGKDTLPSWLHFQESSRQLKGVPSPSDIGQQYLEVIIGGHDNSQAKDVFSISVTGESPAEFVMQPQPSDSGRPNTVRCRRDLRETAVTVVLDTDLDQLTALERIHLMEDMTKFLPLSLDMLKLLPVGNKPFIDNNALVAGPGDVKTPKKSGALLSWLVGCGEVNKDHMPVIMEVEPRAKDGSMSKALGQSIIGWHVTNTEQQAKLRRRRQAIRTTATPVLTQAPPTDLPSQKVPVKDTDTLMRSVPNMESPMFTPTKTADIKPTKTVVMPSASPDDHGHDHSHMMTKLPMPDTTTKKTMIDSVITPSAKPDSGLEPEPRATEILPTKAYTMTDAPTKIPRPVVTDAPPYCPPDDQPRSPFKKNRMAPIYFTAGHFAEFAIHNDLFFDCKDGDTRSLRLDLFKEDSEVLPINSWVGLKHKEDGTWVVQGLPMNMNEGTETYRLTAMNTRGTSPAVENFIIVVLTQDGVSYEKPTHEIALTLNNDFDTFNFTDRLMLMKKIAKLSGDGNQNNIEVLRVERGSVIYAWTNSSLPRDGCPASEIQAMTGKFLREDGTLRKSARNRLAPYKLSGVELAPKGACINNPNFPTLGVKQQPTPEPEPEPTKKPVVPEDEPPYNVETTTPEPDAGLGKAAQGDDDEVWITTVVPAVVIVAILLIALIIACVLYRKKRKGKMSLEDKNTFVNKGAPVIFPDEYDEKPNDSTKPLIMDDEKPPMPPPEYTRASSESSRSSVDNKNDNDVAEELEMNEPDVNSPLYQPPPPVPASGGNKQPRPHVTPAYKNPAPYVPP
ncbi:dystroglycan 1-like [Ylistrum balloti]|uniref:dystroglycan 1-like n=1 Tax=Ylistrum balloti TaxID=509963 RepID=UPI002905EDD8|nr:dystroglycan 1-like [Ylistrum balloti]XP_060070675.1 dystroglycan 1-like [Ylistrum balloti]XP_060070676.1 dystroglycan 1-like [Ylistrum balloti]